MKTIVLAISLLLSSLSGAQVSDSPVKAYKVPVCPNWRFDSTVMGYVCMNQPEWIILSEGLSTRSTIKSLTERIEALEAQIQKLESGIR